MNVSKAVAELRPDGCFRSRLGVRPAVVGDIVSRAGKLVRATPASDEAPRQRDVTWLDPRLLAEVSYAEIMQGPFRNPVFGALVITSPRRRDDRRSCGR